MTTNADLVRMAEGGKPIHEYMSAKLKGPLIGWEYGPEVSPDWIKAALAVIEAARVTVEEHEADNPFVGYTVEHLAAALAAWNALIDPEGKGGGADADRSAEREAQSVDAARPLPQSDDTGPPAPGEGDHLPNPELEMGPC